ncbi:double-strand break repair helicase AddA [Marinibacterium profundimaris]|uniref:DNA 3'-5' helicase n=1 Tax=Marinibacterium profundimaris TaxID=1679460 RepID=A0A225NPG8_9RHOB|nr:double-strand break repair helicase AddA [Marinibacterium profundimaris]OWU75800.1 helicase UvrD [Marinibacterium profundimaris]
MSTARDAASERQVQAARPDASTWLSANAGSGKTRVLTDRVARLLLSGVEPQHILCLTYTKAAASEMQNRLFRRLGEWAMLEDAALRRELAVLGADAAGDLGQARTLFARAIETPGGLKIQTIHSFCAALLRRFPLEAGVSPNFAEMEDRSAELLRAEIVEDMAAGPQAHLVDGIAGYLSEGLDDLTGALTGKREAFDRTLSREEILGVFGVPAHVTEDTLVDQAFAPGDIEMLGALARALQGSGSNDRKAAAKLATLREENIAALAVLEDVLLTGSGAKQPFAAKIGSFPTKSAQKDGAVAPLMPDLEALMQRIEELRPQRLGLMAARKTMALHDFAAAFLPEYARRKQLRGWLDFDDLILKARALLNDPSVAAWVLFRLDGGIDHILVDEAQDTSPAQWDVIEKLAQEFTAGEGAREVERTIFVVGDKKQSIYSFQGADPRAFDKMQAEFGARLKAAGPGLQSLTLEYSFRSSPAILGLVDTIFEGQEEAGFVRDSLHRAFKSDLPGRVELWPVVPKVQEEEDREWHDPVDRKGGRHHAVILAERIAARIEAMIGQETLPDAGRGGLIRRRVRPGDVMILVQRRSDLFAEIIRACKARGLPVAGADRLKVGAELAVRDLGALLSFLSTPEDDLSLATALKSPLFGWSDRDLYAVAQGRPGYLWEALRKRGDHPETLAMLADLMGQTDFLRPYDLIERILTRHDGRRKLLGRLGPEAEDGINALLGQALGYERTGVPSLTGFLGWMETDDLDIKREMGSAGDLIRVMTVHGSKGLESPIVILPDTGKRQAPKLPEIVETAVAEDAETGGAGAMAALWRVNADAMPPLMEDARDAFQDRQRAERQRLLYVALTRAEKWLIVCAAGDLPKDGDSWYQQVEAGLHSAGAVDWPMGEETGLLYTHGDWDGLPLDDPEEVVAPEADLPELFRHPAGPAPEREVTLSPSDLGGAKALPGEAGLEEEAAKARGTAIHLLLEHLAGQQPAGWDAMAAKLLPGLQAEQIAPLMAEARALLSSPELAPLFARDTLAEVPVTGHLGAQRLHGVIDRLRVSDEKVLAVDFKTNAVVPGSPDHVPEGLLRQMGAYALLLRQIYPDRPIEVAILWTRAARLMTLPEPLVLESLQRAGLLDDGGAGS